MNIQENVISSFPLTKSIEGDINFYLISKTKYIIFWDGFVNKNNINAILEKLQNQVKRLFGDENITLIIIGNTTDFFKKNELVYFNSVNIMVVFYLIHKEDNAIFMNDSHCFIMGFSYRKCVRRINEIISKGMIQ